MSYTKKEKFFTNAEILRIIQYQSPGIPVTIDNIYRVSNKIAKKNKIKKLDEVSNIQASAITLESFIDAIKDSRILKRDNVQ